MIRNYSLSAVTITDVGLENAHRKAQEYVRSMEPDRLLAKFQETAGIPKKAEPYMDSWECYMTGYYITAVAQLYRSTGAKDLKDRLEYILEQFAQCQSYDGYLFSGERELFDNVEQGSSTDSPWFSMYKILDALLHVYTIAGMTQALQLAEQLGNWIYWRVKNWKEEVRSRVLETEYGGMNDCLYQLYQLTGKAEYLVAAGQFDELELFQEIADGNDVLDEKKVEATILKFTGALNRYMVLGSTEEFYLKAAVSFFDILTQNHAYVTGEIGERALSDMQEAESAEHKDEISSLYSMLKLAKRLFLATQNKKYMEFYEKLYYRIILGTDNFTCCTGVEMECLTNLGDMIYTQDGQNVYVNLFVDSIISDAVPGVVLQQKVDLSKRNEIVFLVETEQKKKFTLCMRVPEWANHYFSITVNEQETDYAMKKGYLCVEREWQDGDKVKLQLYPQAQPLPAMDDGETNGTEKKQSDAVPEKKKTKVKKSHKGLKIAAACLIPVVLLGGAGFVFRDSIKQVVMERFSFIPTLFRSKEAENSATVVPSVTPVLREVYEENLGQKINETIFPEGYTADVVMVENLEYLMLQKDELSIYYLNEKTEDGKKVLVSNGRKTVNFRWEYDFSDLAALCPKIGSFNSFARQQLVFLHQTDVGQDMHILNANSLTEYYVEEFETALGEAFSVSAYIPAEQGTLLEEKHENQVYL